MVLSVATGETSGSRVEDKAKRESPVERGYENALVLFDPEINRRAKKQSPVNRARLRRFVASNKKANDS